MEDEEDVKKMMEAIKCSQKENLQEFEYEEFINCNDSDGEENEVIIYEDDDYLIYDLPNTELPDLNTYDTRSSLKPEERHTIDSCSDPNLKSLLLLNRDKNLLLMQLHKKIKDLLLECQKNIEEKNTIINAFVESNKGQTHSTGAWRLAAPYFKDKRLFPCPPNDDVQKKANKELSIYDLYPLKKWTSFECDKLLRAVKCNYNINQQTAVRKKIQEVTQNFNFENREEVLEELQARMEQLSSNESNEVPPLNSDEHIDWLRVADVFLKDKHTASECKSMWHVYLHPQINKSSWTPSENIKLKELAEKYNYQNWDHIAQQLDNNRTGFTVCMNYYSNLHENFKRGEFTYEEDARLLDLIYQYKMGNYIPWVKIVQHFNNRTRSQLHYRYTYYLSQNERRKGKFTDAEDVLLMILVDKFGKNFKKCSDYLPTRSMVQLKSRYNSNLRNTIKKGSFTYEEDETIMKFVETHGLKSWADLTDILQRSRGQIRQRYHTIKQFLDNDPNMSLEAVPRRKHKEEDPVNSFLYLRIVADEYKNKSIPSLEEIKRLLKDRRGAGEAVEENEDGTCTNSNSQSTTNQQSFEDGTRLLDVNMYIDDLLTDFFCNTFKINSQKCFATSHMQTAASNVSKVLQILKVDLQIPENYVKDKRLDSSDVEILQALMERGLCNNREHSSEITCLIPPNLNSVVGLRSLLIKYSYYKLQEKNEFIKLIHDQKKRYVSGFRSDMIIHLLSLPPNDRKLVEEERNTFYRRFLSLYKWPAIMTLETPTPELISSTKIDDIVVPIQVKQTYSKIDRKRVPNDTKVISGPVKRLKVTKLPKVVQRPVPLKLTPVSSNKSVIEDLLKNRNKKLFCFDTVKCGDVTKTLIKEVPLDNLKNNQVQKKVARVDTKTNTLVYNVKQTSASTSAVASSSYQETCKFDTENECVITDYDDGESICSYGGTGSYIDDEEDVKKLDMFFAEQHEDLQIEENQDLKDLKKLDMFLKTERQIDDDSCDECI